MDALWFHIMKYLTLTECFFWTQGVTEVLCEACDQLGWKSPTKIQIEAIPVALQGVESICKLCQQPTAIDNYILGWTMSNPLRIFLSYKM